MVRRNILSRKVIYTFWEPRERMPAYLRLCLRTWSSHLPDYAIHVLDYAETENLLGRGTYDLGLLKTLPLPSQKDAFMVALLNRHGGIFMDADTLIRGDISWILDYLEESEAVMFRIHLGFMAARPGAKILSLWEEGIRRRLEEVRRGAALQNEWDFLGNSVLTETMIELTLDLPFCRGFDRLWRTRSSYHAASKGFWQKVANQRRWLVKLPAYRKYLRMLSPKRHSFIAEDSRFGRRFDAVERYRKFWLEAGVKVEEAFTRNPSVIGLHHSRTPDWFRELSEEEVLRRDCLLSQILRAEQTTTPQNKYQAPA